MPKAATVRRARAKRKAGKAPSTQAGEFVREEMELYKKKKSGIKSSKQAVAIGLSMARKAGVRLPAASKKKASKKKTTKKKIGKRPAKKKTTARKTATRKRG